MTDTASQRGVTQRGERAVELRVAARVENLAVLRTLVGAVVAVEDLDLDTVADLRLAVDEICTQLIRSACPDTTLTVVVDPLPQQVVVQASAACVSDDVVSPNSFSWHVLTALADEVKTFHDGQETGADRGVFGVILTTWRTGSGG